MYVSFLRLTFPLRRQRQMCIRDRNIEVMKKHYEGKPEDKVRTYFTGKGKEEFK